MTQLNPRTSSSSVAQQMRDLNTETGAVQSALVQAQASLTHAMKLVELQYHQKRKQIINGHDESEAP